MSTVLFQGESLPDGWLLRTLGEFVAQRSVGILPSKTPGEIFELYSVPSHEAGSPDIVAGREIGSNKQVVEEGTVLLCKINPRINRTWVVSSFSKHQKIASTEWITFPHSDAFEPKFLAYYLRQDVLRDFLAANASGVGGSLMRVKPSTVSDYPVPLAPLNEQTRIVAEIEKQFSRLDEAVANLKRVKANLKRYKAAVLKAAVEGKLTEEWRRQHPDIEPAGKLLEGIKTPPRPNRYETRSKDLILGHAAMAVGNPKTQLPDKWLWSPLVEIARMESGHTPSRRHPEWWGGKIPWLGITDAREYNCRVIHDTIQHTNAEGLANSASRLLPKGTVCVSRTASVGYVVVMGTEMATSQDFVNWVPTDAVTSEWLRVIFSADVEGLRKFGKGTVHKTIYFPEWLSVHIALPPLAEQKQIVAEVERRLSIVAEAEAEVDNNLRRADRLRQSILKQAFSGQLVPQDPNDEPASLLLERIRANADAVATNALPRIKSGQPKRTRHASPPRTPEPKPTTNDFASLDAVLTAILGRMQPGKEYSRADLADPLSLSTGRWNVAIQELKRRGLVRQVGEKRGARYFL